ncbi:L-Aspartase-like protein [Hysterangium stoloniferum]|nr:L-Aspartase-like protein [Hysterangium stoloniferum]
MSISASGDLGPLAYIAAAVTGEGKAKVWYGEGPSRVPIPAPLALTKSNLPATPLLPKEGLAVVNGTAPSCAVAVGGIWDGGWALLGGVALTALALEALHGTMESFVPFLHDVVRPHPGQVEVAAAVRNALEGSRLVTTGWEEGTVGVTAEERLRQDRYSLRTAPQWLGPQIEEALAAHRTVTVEINSTTDNPIIDARKEEERSSSEKWSGNLCGGNFQGTSITVAMEKMRIGLQHVGRIAYAQMVELGQPAMNRGLPPDLAANEPSLDYGQKALDIAAASYLGELSFISNTVSNHVQPAEMHNQSLNSLALVSARYTAEAVQLIQMIHANLLVSLCQALDLRAMYADFFVLMKNDIERAVEEFIEPKLTGEAKKGLVDMLNKQANISFALTSTLDTPERFPALVRPLIADIFTYLSSLSSSFSFSAPHFHTALASSLATSFLSNRGRYFLLPSGAAAPLLGNGTRHLYLWVRKTLGVPMCVGLQGAPAFGVEGDRDEMDVHQTDRVMGRAGLGCIARGLVGRVRKRVRLGGGGGGDHATQLSEGAAEINMLKLIVSRSRVTD